jgi:outer membrane protein, heavy metal efflux system
LLLFETFWKPEGFPCCQVFFCGMETLLVSLTNLILGLSAAETAETPAALLQTHPTVAPIAGSLPIKSRSKFSIKGPTRAGKISELNSETFTQVSDSNVEGDRARAATGSIKLQRGPLGEAFVTSEEPVQLAQQTLPPPVRPTTKMSESPVMPQSPIGNDPILRPSIDLPVTGGASDSGLLKRPSQGPGNEVYQRDSIPLTPGVGKGNGPSEQFPEDINNISPSTTTDDQLPDRQQPVSATITYDEQVRENAPGGAVLTIFQALDQALVKSPRASAIRSLLPVTQSELARATEQPGPDWMYDFGVAAEQTRRTGAVMNFEPPWKLVFRLLSAKRLIEQTKQELLSQLWTLRAEVRLAYTEVVVAQETLETLNSLYDLAHRLMEVSSKRFQAGDVPELDMLKARLAESQYDVERRVGLRRVIRAKQQLNVIMGRKPETPLQIPRLPPFLTTTDIAKAADAHNILLPNFSERIATLEYYLDIAMKHRYELKALERQVAVNKAQLRNAYGNVFPSPQFWMGSSQVGNPPTGPRLSAYYFGVNVPTNLTNFQQGDIAKFKAVERQLKYQNGALKNVITSEISSAYNNVLAARQKLRIYQEHVLADSYEVARLARRSYEVGQSDITSTIQAQQNNVHIRTQYLEAIQLYQQAFTELERACGAPLLEAMD